MSATISVYPGGGGHVPATVIVDSALGELGPRMLAGINQRGESVNLSTANLSEILKAAQVIVMAARRDGGFGTAPLVRRIRSVAPHVAVYVVTPESGLPGGELLQLAQQWTDDVFFLGRRDEVQRLADSIRQRLRVPPPERALRAAAQLVHGSDVASIAMLTLVTAHRLQLIGYVASRFQRSERSLIRLLAEHGLPHYAELRRLGKYLCALELRVVHGLTFGQVARKMELGDTKVFVRARRWCAAQYAEEGAAREWARLAQLYDDRAA